MPNLQEISMFSKAHKNTVYRRNNKYGMLTTLALKILGRLRSSVKIKGIDMMTTEKSSFLPENFANPDKSFRPAPFWSLNGDLKDDQLLEQIKFFKEIGFGGYFMHPRPGMRTHY